MINISYSTMRRSGNIISAFKSVQQPLNDLLNIRSKCVGKALSEIKNKTGLKSISNNSISLQIGKRNICLSSPEPHVYKLTDTLNDKERDVFISYGTVNKVEGLENNPKTIEKFIDEICDLFDLPLLNLRKFFNGNLFTIIKEKFIEPPKLSTKNINTVKEIQDLFFEIDSQMMSVSEKIRCSIKKNYPSLLKGKKGSKQIEFSDQKNGKEYLINILKDRELNDNLVIKIKKADESVQSIIIDHNGEVFKTKYVGQKRNPEGRQKYSQQELDNLGIDDYLADIRTMLTDYNNYIKNRIDQYHKFTHKHSTTSTELFDSELKELSDKISENFKIFRTLWSKKAKESAKSSKLKKEFDIMTTPGTPAIILKNIGKQQEDFRVSFHKIKNINGLKIIKIGYNDSVKQSFYIEDGKLVKFEAKSLFDSPRAELNTNYYSQEEIEQSNVRTYLDNINNRLLFVNKKLSK